MARNGSGTYTLPAKNPVVTGTTIESDWANTTLADIAAALTDSLSRNGNGGMLVPLEMLDGDESGPGITFVNEPTSGFYRAAAGDVRLAILGADALTATATGLVAAGTFEAEGGLVITRPELPAVGQQISSTVTFSHAGDSLADVTGATVTITTTGRPVMVGFMALGNNPLSPGGLFVASSLSDGSLATGYIGIKRGSTLMAVHSFGGTTSSGGNTYLPVPGMVMDTPAAGTYTYKAIIANWQTQTTTQVGGVKFVAYEL